MWNRDDEDPTRDEDRGGQDRGLREAGHGASSFLKSVGHGLKHLGEELKEKFDNDDDEQAQRPSAHATGAGQHNQGSGQYNTANEPYHAGGAASGASHGGARPAPQSPAGQQTNVAAASQNRYGSFVPTKSGNDVKWHVDGCTYMWAVSKALETARESILILDWWLSPELYLRRPPAKNEQYRLDRMLQAAAQRGVKVNIIVYKEVTQALTLSSSHTKHHLEDMHPNIAVFRHPDHLPDKQTLVSSIASSLSNLSLNAASISKMSSDSLKAVYGLNDDVILYWAHHEKLCLVDGHTAFMGGLDLCFGRWDTNHHSIADAHPENLEDIVFPGQDFNNARIADFDDVAHWDQNKVDRKKSSRMGWSDISISLHGPCVADLRKHFVDRWNFIYDEKYNVRKDNRYSRLSFDAHRPGSTPGSNDVPSHHQSGFRDRVQEFGDQLEERAFHHQRSGYGEERGYPQHHFLDHFQRDHDAGRQHYGEHSGDQQGHMSCQLVRSCTKWSNGTPTEHSIQNAYIDIINNSQHFVYIENQFFITATNDQQKPVENLIGRAIVDRIVRAARERQRFKVFVLIPSVPGFAGDLKDDAALGTRAIMEFQYHSINRGHGHSIIEQLSKEGINASEYIRFYNLRNYDRINASKVMRDIEQRSGVDYEEARVQQDNYQGAGYGGQGEEYGDGSRGQYGNQGYGESGHQGRRGDSDREPYQQYQQAARHVKGGRSKWDSIASCYMLGGEDVRNIHYEEPGDVPEIDAFVSEELYIHSKVLIADDRIVICGSANLNDRSQLGTHDSEIALVIEDQTPVDTTLNGRPWRASRFAASLRRQLFRKHLGLIPPQDYERPDANFEPVGVPNEYDWGSREDRLVEDPLSPDFENYWNGLARTNTEVFRQVFHAVPDDTVRTWKDYDKFFEYYFKPEGGDDDKNKKPARYEWGHVVRENFAPGEEGLRQVKELLSRVRGSLVEMPLDFLDKEDIAKSGTQLNALTEPVYT